MNIRQSFSKKGMNRTNLTSQAHSTSSLQILQKEENVLIISWLLLSFNSTQIMPLSYPCQLDHLFEAFVCVFLCSLFEKENMFHRLIMLRFLGFAGKVWGGLALPLKICAPSHKGCHTIEEFKILLPNSTLFLLPDACQMLSLSTLYISKL